VLQGDDQRVGNGNYGKRALQISLSWDRIAVYLTIRFGNWRDAEGVSASFFEQSIQSTEQKSQALHKRDSDGGWQATSVPSRRPLSFFPLNIACDHAAGIDGRGPGVEGIETSALPLGMECDPVVPSRPVQRPERLVNFVKFSF
jgi:hypothetical protein